MITVITQQFVIKAAGPGRFLVTGGHLPSYQATDVALYPAAENISALRVVRGNGSGGVMYADASDYNECKGAFGISVTAATTGNNVKVRHSGKAHDALWSWSPGPIFLGANGVLQQTVTPGHNFLQVAVAIDETTINVEIQQPVEVV